MQVDQLVVEVRNVNLGRIGQLDFSSVNDLKIIKRLRGVGAWTVTLPYEDAITKELMKPGSGIIAHAHLASGTKTFFSGRMINWKLVQTPNDPDGLVSFIGVDDNVHLADGYAWPQPSNPDASTQNVGHDIRTGFAESIMKQYVDLNIGPGAPAVRRIAPLRIAPDTALGANVTGRARFDQLGQLLNDIGVVAGLGFDIVQVDNLLWFNTYVPVDRSDVIRMDVRNDTLDEASRSMAAPTTTRPIVAGQGDLELRRILQFTNAAATAEEVAWGRKIEMFLDRRDTPEDAELEQTAMEALETGGTTIHSLAVRPADEETMQFIEHWYVGDVVQVVVDDEPLSSIVTEAIVSVSADGVKVGALVGAPTQFDYEAQVAAKLENHEARLAFLEKNAEKGSEPPIVGLSAGNGIIFSGGPGTPGQPDLEIEVDLAVVGGTVIPDSGWIAIPTASGFTSRSDTPLQVRRIGNRVVVAGGVDGTLPPGYSVVASPGAIPAEFRPTGQVMVHGGGISSGGNAIGMEVHSNGQVVFGHQSGSNRVWASGEVSYFIGDASSYTGEEYILDTGWVTLADRLNSPWSGNIDIRRIGKVVELKAILSGSFAESTSSEIISLANAVAPEFRPSLRNSWGTLYIAGHTGTVFMRPNGTLGYSQLTGGARSGGQFGITYFADA